MAILATSLRWLVTSFCAASRSSCSRQRLASMYSCWGSSIGNLRISARYLDSPDSPLRTGSVAVRAMQRLASKGRQRGLAFGAEMAGLGLEMRAINGISHQGMTNMGQMHPDLMGPAGLEPAGEKAGDRLAVASGKRLLDLPMRDRLAA